MFANLGSTAEARRAVDAGAEGVGLLRTEFLFLDRATLPSEDEQTEQLTEIATALAGRPLIVRTLDAGADKPLPALPMAPEQNPFLGVRGIRLSLARPELLATQLRAALRVADAGHPLKLMLPMVATLDEITATKELLQQARLETGIDAPIELGIMVEIPAAALTAARLAPHVDFFSIGTNDLTQYTMAAERGDARLAALLDGPQPAVLRLVHETVRAATAAGRWVGVCGELAGDPAAAVLLAGLGVTELSMAPGLIAGVKQALRSVSLAAARDAADSGARRRLRARCTRARTGPAVTPYVSLERPLDGGGLLERAAILAGARRRHRPADRCVPGDHGAGAVARLRARGDRVPGRSGDRLVRRPARAPLGGDHQARRRSWTRPPTSCWSPRR